MQINPHALKKARESRALTQEELARVAGFDVRTIQRAEANGRARQDTVEYLAEALGVTINDLRTDVVAPEPMPHTTQPKSWVVAEPPRFSPAEVSRQIDSVETLIRMRKFDDASQQLSVVDGFLTLSGNGGTVVEIREQLKNRLADKSRAANNLSVLGDAYLARDALKARECLESARDLATTKRQLGLILTRSATAKGLAGDLRGCLKDRDASVTIALQEKSGNTCQRMCNRAGTLRLYGSVREALETSYRAMSVYDPGKQQDRCLYHLARCHLDLGDTASARNLAEKGMQLAERMGHNLAVRGGHLVLARICEQAGNLEQAARHYEMVAALAEQQSVVYALGRARWGLARVAVKELRESDAIDLYFDAIPHLPPLDQPIAKIKLGALLCGVDEADKGMEFLTSGLQEGENLASYPGKFARALALFLLGHERESLEQYYDIARLDVEVGVIDRIIQELRSLAVTTKRLSEVSTLLSAIRENKSQLSTGNIG